MKSLILILVNTTAGTFHPIVYLEKPMPGNTQPSDEARRYKSKFHHTEGFATREEAQQNIKDDLAPKIAEHFSMYGTPHLDFENSPEWDGQDIPASVIVYSEQDSNVIIG